MPVYEYRCGKCDEKFEVFVRSRSQKIRCPGCGGKKITKLFSVFGIGGGSSDAGAAPRKTKSGCGSSGGG